MAETAPVPEVSDADAPQDLSAEARQVWLELAPHAMQNGTLTEATALGFKLMCRNIVLEREFAASVQERGGASHRGLIQRIDAELLRFNLAPCGKPVSAGKPQPAAVDPLKERYFGGR